MNTTSFRSADAQHPPTLFQFSAAEFHAGDFERFRAHFCPTQRSASSLLVLRNSIGVQVPGATLMGWIPSIDDQTRRFARQFHAAFPYWGFFFSLRLPALWTLSVALLDDVDLVTIGVATQVRFRGRGLSQVLGQHALQADQLAEHAGATTQERATLRESLHGFFIKSARLSGAAD